MKKQRLPKGWTQKRIREPVVQHDNTTGAEQASEIETALSSNDQTVMVVPTKLVPKIHDLIARQGGRWRRTG